MKTLINVSAAVLLAFGLASTAQAAGPTPAKRKAAPAKRAAPAPAAPSSAPAAAPAPAADAPASEAAPSDGASAPASESATEGASAGTYRAPYGMAGCGLGTLLIKSDGKGAQIGAWFLNSLYTNQTSAITSGTSNCKSKGGSAALTQEQETFVAANMTRLSQEAAQGGGAHLASFAEVLGCQGDNASRFATLSQEKFDFIFATEDAAGVVQRTHEVIKGNQLSCQRV